MMEQNMDLLAAASSAYSAAAYLRQRRFRYKQFTYGAQWGDVVRDYDGRWVTEGEVAARNGRVPLTNNMIRRLVKNIVGRFRSDLESSGSKSDAAADMNRLDELDSRMLEEFLISGCAIQRICCERRTGGTGVWVDNIDPRRFFVDRMSDPRASDVEMVGMIRDMSMSELLMRYSGGNPAYAAEIRALYASMATGPAADAGGIGTAGAAGFDFLRGEAGRCRVIEVWTLDARERYLCHDPLTAGIYAVPPEQIDRVKRRNRTRRSKGEPEIVMKWDIGVCWRCRVLAPTGHVLYEQESTLPGGVHPFVMKFYPLTDGEVHSFVEDVIDQQKYVNRLITLIDNIMSSSAKGVLLFPEDQLGTGMSWNDVGQMWSAYDSIIPYRPRVGSPPPQQIVSHGSDAGASELLKLEMKLFEDVSGVAGVLQGRTESGATSAQLYEAQLRAATTAISDLLATFNDFRSTRDRLLTAVEAATPML